MHEQADVNDMSETLVKVENVSKKFCRDLKRSLWYGMKDLGSEILCRSHNGDRKLRKDEFWAVKDISFELKRGECLGLIGRNGAGKTTLLRMLNGLIKPDWGRIEMRGRVGALIALGAGFNPVLTGRENIYVNAAVMGLKRREIDAKFDEVLNFAELGEFIDAPVQSYSSGMTVRLGFAVATSLEPDILILDEILAVGDAYFKQKCLHRISALMSKAAVIIVSHDEVIINRICSRGLLLTDGVLQADNKINEVFSKYSNSRQYSDVNEFKIFSNGLSFRKDNHLNQLPIVLKFGEQINFSFSFNASRPFHECLVVLTFSCENINVLQAHEIVSFPSGFGILSLIVERVYLIQGYFNISLTVMEKKGRLTIASWLNFEKIKVIGRNGYGISNQAPLIVKMKIIRMKSETDLELEKDINPITQFNDISS